MGKRLNILLFFFALISFPANAETYKLQCIYEQGGKKTIIIDEQNKKITNNPDMARIIQVCLMRFGRSETSFLGK